MFDRGIRLRAWQTTTEVYYTSMFMFLIDDVSSLTMPYLKMMQKSEISF